MSFNTTLRTNIVYSHKTYDEKWKVEEDLEEAKRAKRALIWDLVRKNTTLESYELEQLEAELQDACKEIWGLELLLNDWDKLVRDQQGNFVRSQEFEPMIWGDFINVKSVEDLK